MAEKVMGIYYILNTVTGKHYVGSSVDVERRFKTHRRALQLGTHHSALLQRSWDKHGAAAFEFSVAEPVSNRADLLTVEQVWIDMFGDMNASRFANRPAIPPMTLERRQHLSRVLKGRPSPTKGVPHTEEAKRKMSVAQSKVDRSNSGPAISRGKLGIPMSGAAKAKLSQSRKGIKPNLSPEHRERMADAVRKIHHLARAANLGRKHTEATLEKMRAAWVRRRSQKENPT